MLMCVTVTVTLKIKGLSFLIDARIRTVFRVSEETIDDGSHKLQVMSDRAHGSSEGREVHVQAIGSHNQATRACTTPVLTPPVCNW